jgi:hypothetical protein
LAGVFHFMAAKKYTNTDRMRANQDFRATVELLLRTNAHNVGRWLREVAEGSEAKGLDADPARALDILAKLAEFAAPKFTRMELTGGNGEKLGITNVSISFIDRPAPAAAIEMEEAGNVRRLDPTRRA